MRMARSRSGGCRSVGGVVSRSSGGGVVPLLLLVLGLMLMMLSVVDVDALHDYANVKPEYWSFCEAGHRFTELGRYVEGT